MMFFFCLTDQLYRVMTPSDYDHDYVWLITDRNSFQFQVKACYDVHIGLSSIPSNKSAMAYEIIMGANRNLFTIIRFISLCII